jgi:hypothetical protein
MRNGTRASWQSLIAIIAFLVFSGGAAAQTTINVGPFSVNCTSSGQLCSPTFDIAFTTNGLLQVSYTASPGHCSDVNVHFLVDGVELGATGFLAPGVSSGVLTLAPVSPGSHTLSLQGEGRIGGCNVGSVGNWGGTAQITVDQVVAQAVPVPAPGWPPAAIMIVLATLLIFRRRARR